MEIVDAELMVYTPMGACMVCGAPLDIDMDGNFWHSTWNDETRDDHLRDESTGFTGVAWPKPVTWQTTWP